jgi:hypothetical protein
MPIDALHNLRKTRGLWQKLVPPAQHGLTRGFLSGNQGRQEDNRRRPQGWIAVDAKRDIAAVRAGHAHIE